MIRCDGHQGVAVFLPEGKRSLYRLVEVDGLTDLATGIRLAGSAAVGCGSVVQRGQPTSSTKTVC